MKHLKSMMRLIIVLSMMFMIVGCSQNSCTYPTFPTTTKEVGKKIQSLHDKDVDNWIVELRKLQIKLEINK